jgi:RIO kinase 1
MASLISGAGQFDDAEDVEEEEEEEEAVVNPTAEPAPRRPLQVTRMPSPTDAPVVLRVPAAKKPVADSPTAARRSDGTPGKGALKERDEDEDEDDAEHGDGASSGHEEVDYDDYDDLEADMLGEGGGLGHAMGRRGDAAIGEQNLPSVKMNFSQRTTNELANVDKVTTKRSAHTGRDDRATSEQVMDPRTRIMLFKLLNSGFISDIDGCLSTGKEANVYYARAGGKAAAAAAAAAEHGRGGGGSMGGRNTTLTEYAVKVFKTSILVFKDRDKYVSGEFRFRHGYCKSNPRKMVKTWAEKEMRNLRRLHAAGIPSPEPVLLKNHILVMQFIGANGWPAPRLKDAHLSDRRLAECYWHCVRYMRRMFQVCKLVHGDLSEYNMLYLNDDAADHCGLYFIDVSQSVEHDHPHAAEFLRKDCANVNAFFGRGGRLRPMSTRQLYEFVTDDALREDEEEARLTAIQLEVEAEAAEASARDRDAQAVDEAVFMSTFLPRSLSEIPNVESDAKKLGAGEREDAYASAVAGMLNVMKPNKERHRSPRPVLLSSTRRSDESSSSSSSSSNSNSAVEEAGRQGSEGSEGSEGDGEESRGEGDAGIESEEDDADDLCEDEEERQPGEDGREWAWDGDPAGRLPPSGSDARAAAKVAKKAAAQKAKEDAREKRKAKLPKHVKKKATKSKGQGNKKK